MIIDDDEGICQFAATLMNDVLDTEILTFTYAAQALKHLKDELDAERPSVDAILCDLQMPELCGHDFLIELRSLGLNIPVVFLSGHINEQTVTQALRLGAFDVISKPPNKVVLTKTMEAAAQVGAKIRENSIKFEQIKKISHIGAESGDTKLMLINTVDHIQKNHRMICLLTLRNYASKVD